jgi:hypothetical protein
MKKWIAIGTVLVVGWFLVFLFLPEFREDLPSLRDYVKELKGEYPALEKVKYRYAHGSFEVDVHVSDMEEAEVIKQDLQTFLSSADFQKEFLASVEDQRQEDGASGLMPSYPDICLSCYPQGEKERQWASYAMYYTEPYRSDQVLEVDGYQTWYTE